MWYLIYMDESSRLSTPEKQKVITLFGSKGYFFRIPKYQRSYIWSDRGKSEQLIQFWDDFLDTEKSHGNLPFLGNLILSKTDEKSIYEVVDGQQRLITLQILFRVILSTAKNIVGDDKSYDQKIDSLRATLLSVDDYGERQERKLIAGKDIDLYLKDIIQTGTLSSTPTQREPQWYLWNACRFFNEKINEYIEPHKTVSDKMGLLMGLFKKIGEVEFIIILLQEQSDAYEVFEGFNAKGEKLNTSDLFKNLLLSKLQDNEDKAFKQWSSIEDNIRIINRYLPQFNIDTYLRYYWSAENGYISPRTLYRVIKDSTTNYQGLLEGLEKQSGQLVKLLDIDNLTPMAVSTVFSASNNDPSGKESNKIQSSIKMLTSLRSQQYIVWLLCLMRNWKHIENRKHVANSLQAIESFSVLYFTGGASSANRVEKIFCSLSHELSKAIKGKGRSGSAPRSIEAIILQGFKQYIRDQSLLPTRQEFITQTSKFELNPRNKGYIWNLLGKIEKDRRKTSELQLDHISVTVEHLLPQSPVKGWGLNKSDIKSYIDLFGNLTLLDFMINGSVQNEVPEKKLRGIDKDARAKYLDDSELKITLDVVDQWKKNGFVWDENLILKRQKEITSKLYDVYLPNIVCGDTVQYLD